MLLLLEESIRRANGDLPFFQMAYEWKFHRQTDVWGDVLAWRTQKQIPGYVSDFLRFTYDLPKV